MTRTTPAASPSNSSNVMSYVKFICFSAFGVIVFFTPVTFKGATSIPLDHLITLLKAVQPVATIGGVLPWIDKSFRRSALSFVISVFRAIGIPVCFMGILGVGPGWLRNSDFIPFAWQRIAVDVTVIVTFGSLFLTFIIVPLLLE